MLLGDGVVVVKNWPRANKLAEELVSSLGI